MTPKPTDPVHLVLTEDQIAKLLYVLKLDNLLDPTDVIIITNRLRIRKDVPSTKRAKRDPSKEKEVEEDVKLPAKVA